MNPTGALSELDEYRFEAGGWVVLPAILTAEQLAGLNALLDEVCVRARACVCVCVCVCV